jgi:amino acid permease
MNIEESMRRRRFYPWLLDVCMIFVTFMYIAFGGIGYLCFGDATNVRHCFWAELYFSLRS